MPVPAASPAHTPNFRQHYLHQMAGLNVLTRLGIALAVCALCWWLAPADFRLGTRAIAGWDGFCVAILGLTWVATVTADAAQIRRVATAENPSRTWSFVGVLFAAGASLAFLQQRGIKLESIKKCGAIQVCN